MGRDAQDPRHHSSGRLPALFQWGVREGTAARRLARRSPGRPLSAAEGTSGRDGGPGHQIDGPEDWTALERSFRVRRPASSRWRRGGGGFRGAGKGQKDVKGRQGRKGQEKRETAPDRCFLSLLSLLSFTSLLRLRPPRHLLPCHMLLSCLTLGGRVTLSETARGGDPAWNGGGTGNEQAVSGSTQLVHGWSGGSATSNETEEWLTAFEQIISTRGTTAPGSCSRSCSKRAMRRTSSSRSPATRPTSTPSPPSKQPAYPGDRDIERRIKSLVRWNAMAMVVRANKQLRRPRRAHLHLRLLRHALRGRLQPLLPRPRRRRLDGDMIYFQGHASPGIYARAFLEGRSRPSSIEELPPGTGAGRRAVVLPAPLADARLLAVPHGLDGPRADHGHLPGPLQPLPARPRPARSARPARSGLPRRRRERRAGDRWAPSRSPRARSSTT